METLYRVKIPNGSSLYPCDELSTKEREFLKSRSTHVCKGLSKLGINTDEVPLIGILGSGGGTRAAIAYGGAMHALYEAGLLDVVTYAAGLSGSTWYLSHLYGLNHWPKLSPEKLSIILQKNLESLTVDPIIKDIFLEVPVILGKKRASGQRSTLVDVWGNFLAGILEPKAEDVVLSSEEESEGLYQGTAPLPLYSAVIVKPTVEAGKFNEWVEFSPYEFTMPKYGVSMNLKSFNKKLHGTETGDNVFEEKLSYLQGIWGSAFAILASNPAADSNALSYEEEVQLLRQALLKAAEEEQTPPMADVLPLEFMSWPNYLVYSVKSPMDLLKMIWIIACKHFGRTWRAAKIFSAIHRLPVEPIGPIENCELFQPYGVEEEEVDIVDAGLAFNLPFPPLLRRKVKLILSFDFSARSEDNSSPLKELKKAEKWAKEYKIPFPEIDETLFEKKGMKEVYVFEDEKNPDCPIILHFPLVNLTYPEHFNIFPAEFPTLKILYEFERLFKLMAHNVGSHINVIKDNIKKCVNIKKP